MGWDLRKIGHHGPGAENHGQRAAGGGVCAGPDGARCGPACGGHQVVPDQAPVAAGPEQVIPFLKHPCTLPAPLAAYPCFLIFAFSLTIAFTTALEMGSDPCLA